MYPFQNFPDLGEFWDIPLPQPPDLTFFWDNPPPSLFYRPCVITYHKNHWKTKEKSMFFAWCVFWDNPPPTLFYRPCVITYHKNHWKTKEKSMVFTWWIFNPPTPPTRTWSSAALCDVRRQIQTPCATPSSGGCGGIVSCHEWFYWSSFSLGCGGIENNFLLSLI